MCNPASMIVTRERILWLPTTDSHEDIIDHYKLNDGIRGGDFVRVEIVPRNGDYAKPFSEWRFSTDQYDIPEWYSEAWAEAECRKELPKWAKGRVFSYNGRAYYECKETDGSDIPENFTVGGHLDLGDCTSLKQLPDSLTVNGHLVLWRCTSLNKLPENFTVNGNLHLRGCTSLNKLPDSLTVNGNLSLWRCTSLKQLPDSLTVGGHLHLCGCTSLKQLPENLTVGGIIYR